MLFHAADLLKDRLVRSASRTIGVLPHRSDSTLALAAQLRDLFERLDVQVVLDAGAGRGGYRDFLRRWVGFEGLIVSFEPSRRRVSDLMERARHDDRWFVRDFALMDEDGERLVELPADDPDSLEVRYERVWIRRLDSVLPILQRRLGFGGYFLKLDGLGRDMRLLDGAEMSLEAAVGLQAEVAVTGLYGGRPAFSDAAAELRQRGFSACGMFVVPKERRYLGADFDCVMVRDGLMPDQLPN